MHELRRVKGLPTDAARCTDLSSGLNALTCAFSKDYFWG